LREDDQRSSAVSREAMNLVGNPEKLKRLRGGRRTMQRFFRRGLKGARFTV
jgi:hypothetical protein